MNLYSWSGNWLCEDKPGVGVAICSSTLWWCVNLKVKKSASRCLILSLKKAVQSFAQSLSTEELVEIWTQLQNSMLFNFGTQKTERTAFEMHLKSHKTTNYSFRTKTEVNQCNIYSFRMGLLAPILTRHSSSSSKCFELTPFEFSQENKHGVMRVCRRLSIHKMKKKKKASSELWPLEVFGLKSSTILPSEARFHGPNHLTWLPARTVPSPSPLKQGMTLQKIIISEV